jgi:hypothetical protein
MISIHETKSYYKLKLYDFNFWKALIMKGKSISHFRIPHNLIDFTTYLSTVHLHLVNLKERYFNQIQYKFFNK